MSRGTFRCAAWPYGRRTVGSRTFRGPFVLRDRPPCADPSLRPVSRIAIDHWSRFCPHPGIKRRQRRVSLPFIYFFSFLSFLSLFIVSPYLANCNAKNSKSSVTSVSERCLANFHAPPSRFVPFDLSAIYIYMSFFEQIYLGKKEGARARKKDAHGRTDE